jgi:uncharacterized membrane protein YhhN
LDSKLIVSFLLFVVFLYASVGAITGYGFEKYRWTYYTKPFIMPVLLLYYLINAHTPHPILIIAMICAFIGDFFLMLPINKKYFITGKLSFFLMLILFVVFIWNYQLTQIVLTIPALIIAGMHLLFGIIIFVLLYRYLGSLLLPMIFYVLLLLTVSYLCFLNVMEHKTEIAFVQYSGSLLLLISDTVFTFDSFRKPIRFGGIYIMITYIVAQIFLITGFMNT